MVGLVWDREAAMERVDSDLDLFFEVVQVLLDELPSDKARLAEAVAANDYQKTEREAHRIKSAVGNLGAMEAYNAAHNLERAAFDGKSSLVTEHQELLDAISRFTDMMKNLER
jgi:HPt (histidine-containing phosphotransfer) domain-containing protein